MKSFYDAILLGKTKSLVTGQFFTQVLAHHPLAGFLLKPPEKKRRFLNFRVFAANYLKLIIAGKIAMCQLVKKRQKNCKRINRRTRFGWKFRLDRPAVSGRSGFLPFHVSVTDRIGIAKKSH